MSATKRQKETIELWLEKDLTAAAGRGGLASAYEVSETLDQVHDIVAAGLSPVLSGEPGVGKTASIYQLILNLQKTGEPAAFRGKRILQFSFRRRISACDQCEKIRPAVEEFFNLLCAQKDAIVPFFSDFHRVYELSLESLIERFATVFNGPFLCEGRSIQLNSMFEYEPELQDYFVIVPCRPPDAGRVREIVRLCCEDKYRTTGVAVSPEAQSEAMSLSYRFPGRKNHPRKVLDLIRDSICLTAHGSVIGPDEILDRFCKTYRVPRFLVDPDFQIDFDLAEARFSEEVLGQADAVRTIMNSIRIIMAQLTDAHRAFGVFLFAGPTGVGKTLAAKLLAEFLFGSRDHFIRLNMADFQEDRASEIIFGDPNGEDTRRQRGILTNKIVGNPFAVLLLDEFEKADRKVIDRFMQLIDEGCFINGASETIVCRSMILIATTNAGAEVYEEEAIGFSGETRQSGPGPMLEQALRKRFRTEFLNRFDKIVFFRPLDVRTIRRIAEREIRTLEDRDGLSHRRLKLKIDDGVLTHLAEKGFEPVYGARFLKRVIREDISSAVASAILRETRTRDAAIRLSVDKGEIKASFDAKA